MNETSVFHPVLGESICTEAQQNQIDVLVELVNQAYRPDEAEQSWSNEAHLVKGNRISQQQMQALWTDHSTLLILKSMQMDTAKKRLVEKILGCVYIEYQDTAAYIGMLTIAITYQNQGLGHLMLGQAEQHIKKRAAIKTIQMSVLSGRPELLAFYQRRGYQLTGESSAYPVDADVGQPFDANLKIIKLEKNLMV